MYETGTLAASFVGKGMYTLADAALYARLSVQTVGRWMFGDRRGKPVLRPEGDPGEKILTYVDLMQLLAVREIRLNAGFNVSLQKIRDAVRRAEDLYQIDFPLARKHTTFVCGGTDIVIQVDDDALVQVSGKVIHQHVDRSIVEHFLKDVSFSADGLANSYEAFGFDELVVIEPGQHLGDPVVKSCGVTALTLAHAYRVEGTLEAAAAVYDVPEAAVDIAYRYLDHLEGRTAA